MKGGYNKQINTKLEDKGVVVALVRSVAATEDEHPILSNLAGRVVSSRIGDISEAGLQGPFNRVVVEDAEGVEIVFGEEILGVEELFRLFQPSEHVMGFSGVGPTNGDDGVTCSGRREVACLFDLRPRYGQWLS